MRLTSASGRRAFLRDGWASTQIEEIAEVVNRGRAPAYEGGITPVVNQKCIREGFLDLSHLKYTNEETKLIPDWAVLREGDLVITSTGRGTIGRSALIEGGLGRLTCDSHVTIVRPDRARVEPAFLAAVLGNSRHALESLATGSTNQTELKRASIASFVVPLPSFKEQRRIANLLASIDGAAAGAHERFGTAIELKVRFLGSMLESLASEERQELGSLAEVQSGLSWGKSDELSHEDPGGIGDMGVSNVQRDHVHAHGCTWIQRTPQAEKRVIEPHTILTIRTNGNADRIGNVHLAPSGAVGFTISSFLTAITPSEPDEAGYILRVLQSPQVQSAITAATSGSTGLKNIAVTWLRQLAIPWPELERRREIAATASALDAAAAAHENEALRLSDLRQAMLTALLSRVHTIPASYDRFLSQNGTIPDLESSAV
jgi:type I restriction enzyme S subunit